jgi:hypothetical protein
MDDPLTRGTISVFTLATLILTAPASAAVPAMIAYGKSGSTSPHYRTWDGTSWSAEASASSVGAKPYWVVLRASPNGTDYAMAVVDDQADLNVQVWDGTSWSAATEHSTNVGQTTTRVFDLAYEQVSGHSLLVYREHGSSSLRYRTYDGTSWSAESTYSLISTAAA